MTAAQETWLETARAEYFEDLLANRQPESLDASTRIGGLALKFGAETVISVIDALEGFNTPDPTPEALGVYAYLRHFTRLARASRVQ